jgi:hypothetical protein
MVLRILEEPVDETSQPVEVSIAARLAGCAVACLIALIPAVATSYGAYQLTKLLRGMKDAESVPNAAAMASRLSSFNLPIIIGLAICAVLALGFALVLATNPRLRLASVGLPCTIAILFMAAWPALLLWNVETRVLDVYKMTRRDDMTATAQTIAFLLFCAFLFGLLTQAASVIAPLTSLLIKPQSRSDPLAPRRAMVWLFGATLLLVFSGAYVIVA